MSVSVKGPHLQKLQIASRKWASKPLKFFSPKKQVPSLVCPVTSGHTPLRPLRVSAVFRMASHGRVRRIRQADATEESPNSETSEAGVRVWSAKLGKLWVMNQQKSGVPSGKLT